MNRQNVIDKMINSGLIKEGRVNRNISRSKKMLEIYNLIPMIYMGLNKSETIYRFVNDIKNAPMCDCGSLLTFISYKKGYNEHCDKCRYSEERTKKIKSTKKEKYGDENYVNPEKALETKKEKYNGDYSEIVLKAENTKLKKYGDKYPTRFGSEKFKESMVHKYGVEHNTLIPGFYDKLKKIFLKKYGVDHPMKLNSIKEKARQTCLERYGVENILVLESSKKKAKEVLKEKYGVDNPGKSKVIRKKTNETIRKKTYKKYSQLDTVEALFDEDDYVNNNYENKYHWKCKTCNTIFEDDIFAGRLPRCPSCFPILSWESKGEIEIFEFIEKFTKAERKNRVIISPYELDIYLPDHNLAIEFNGLYWHSELNGKDKYYHLNKTNMCEEKGIRLIHIFEDEWIYKQDIVKSIILNAIGHFDQKIGARKCSIKMVNNNTSKEFLNLNHIQSYCPSSVNIGLFFENDLISLLSFTKSRYNKNFQWEISRFANKLNYSISGSFSKLLKYFKNEYDPESIITYSDRRLFSGNLYQTFFTKLNPSNPSYWYLDKNYNRYNRTNFQKHKLKNKLHIFNKELTEWENMQLNGYNRIWDCGNNVYEWRKNEI